MERSLCCENHDGDLATVRGNLTERNTPDAQGPITGEAADRNLLFGLLALQINLIDRRQLVRAFEEWVADKSQAIDQLLVQHEALTDADRAPINNLVQRHLSRHDQDVEKSLASLRPVGSVHEALGQIADPEVQAGLSLLSLSPQDLADDPFGTLGGELPMGGGTRFRILRPHAKGGLGEVYLAEDTELNRQVALKRIQRPYADRDDARARFLLEAEITGGLEHPGIVPVYGLGVNAKGQPFYAMRFIRGDSLKQAADRFYGRSKEGQPLNGELKRSAISSLEFRKLLGRFIDVCETIEYVHSRGVLHRDLKPCNIMLGKYGETLVVDWGLAKVKGRPHIEGPSDEATLRPTIASGAPPTHIGAAIGTPSYMSPEQAAGQVDQLGPASDVYSLGATLYYALTGRSPFGGNDAGATLAKVRAGKFPRPREINPQVPQSLEAVCLKAMSLRQADRYAAAQELADDVERWLADEPVSARAEPATLKARRWLRRHPKSVAALAATLLVSLTCVSAAAAVVSHKNQELAAANHGLQASNLAERRALVAEREAKEEANDKRLEAEASRLAERQAKLDAQSRHEEAESARAQEAQARQRAEVARLAERQAKLDAQAKHNEAESARAQEAQARQRAETARLAERQAKLDAQTKHEEAELAHAQEAQARQRAEAVAGYLVQVFRSPDPKREGRTITMAEVLGRSVDDLKDKFGEDSQTKASLLHAIAQSFQGLGLYHESIPLFEQVRNLLSRSLGAQHRETLALTSELAAAYLAAGRTAEALPLVEETILLQTATLGADDAATLISTKRLGDALYSSGRATDALSIYEGALTQTKARLGESDPHTVTLMNDMATACLAVGRTADALAMLEETLKVQRERLGPDHPYTLIAMSNKAHAFGKAGKKDEAISLFEETLELRKSKLGLDHPDTLASMNSLASAYHEALRLKEAVPLYQETLERTKARLGGEHPATLMAMNDLGAAYLAIDRTDESWPLLEETLKLQKAAQGPDHPHTLVTMDNLVKAYCKNKQPAKALDLLETMLKLRSARLGADHPDTLTTQKNLEKVKAWRIDNSKTPSVSTTGARLRVPTTPRTPATK